MNAATLTYLSINDRIYKVSSQRILRVIEVPLRTRCPKFSESVTRLWRSVLCLPRSRSRILQIGPCGRSWCATLGTLSLLMDLSDCQLDQLSDDFLHCLMPRPICHATRVSLIIPASSHDRHRMRADFHGRSVSLSSCAYTHQKCTHCPAAVATYPTTWAEGKNAEGCIVHLRELLGSILSECLFKITFAIPPVCWPANKLSHFFDGMICTYDTFSLDLWTIIVTILSTSV